jgi:hypothetical protein
MVYRAREFHTAAQFFAGSRPRLPSPTGPRADPEAQGLGCPKSDYSKHRSAESHYAYGCSGAVAASPAGGRLSGGLL